eukprot:10269198-Prorocentrum_lima.AAC.1
MPVFPVGSVVACERVVAFHVHFLAACCMFRSEVACCVASCYVSVEAYRNCGVVVCVRVFCAVFALE